MASSRGSSGHRFSYLLFQLSLRCALCAPGLILSAQHEAQHISLILYFPKSVPENSCACGASEPARMQLAQCVARCRSLVSMARLGVGVVLCTGRTSGWVSHRLCLRMCPSAKNASMSAHCSGQASIHSQSCVKSPARDRSPPQPLHMMRRPQVVRAIARIQGYTLATI